MTISPDEFESRRRRAMILAKDRGLKGLLVCARGGGTLDRYGDVLYLANYYTPFPYIPDLAGQWTGRAHAFLILPVEDEPLLVIDSPNDGDIALPDSQLVYTDLVLEEIVRALQRRGLTHGPLGLVGGDVLPTNSFRAIAGALPEIEWHDAQAIVNGLRAIKSPAEIERLRHSAQVGSRTIEAMMAAAEESATHGAVVAAGQKVLNESGGALYNSFMASGKGGPDPVLVKSHFPTWGSQAPLETGHWLRLGISGVVGGYVFDVSRSKAIGPASNRQIDLFEGAIEVVEAGISAITPGATAADLAAVGRQRQTDLGFPLTGDFEETVLVTEEGIEKLTDAQLRFW